jgi:hypothetical protein
MMKNGSAQFGPDLPGGWQDFAGKKRAQVQLEGSFVWVPGRAP